MSGDFWVNCHRFSFAVFESGTVCLLNLITSKSANAHASRYNGGDLRNALAHDFSAMRTKIQLIRGQDSMTVEADLVELVQKHVNDYASEWKEQLRLYGQEDKFWDWEFKLQFVIHRQPNREGYAIEYESKTQGLILIETQMHGSRISEGKRLVYIDGIASAPWNREFIQHPPKLKGVGTALLAFARNRSIELGYEGRVGLHSLPGAEEFYDHQGMIDLGEDEDYEDLVYFEYGVRRSSE